MSKYEVVEKFVSINGEGTKAGQLAVFIRFKGCNLNCKYCDTKWANEQGTPSQPMTEKEILDYVLSTGVKNVTLTGGEPLLREGIENVITEDNAEDTLRDASPELGLYAKTDILYKSRTYGLGDKLPTDEPEMIAAWLRAETAEWR